MTVHLHIENLVIEGLGLGPGQGDALREAVQRELSLLVARGRPGILSFTRSMALHSIVGGTLHADSSMAPGVLGAGIAAAVYSRIGGRQ